MTDIFSRVRRLAALFIGVGTLVLAVWIVLPAPTYFFLRFSVGAAEVSAWLALASLLALLLSLPEARARRTRDLAFRCALASLLLALSPYARFPFAAARFDREMTTAFGSDSLLELAANSHNPKAFRTPSLTMLLRGVPLGEAKITKGILVASPSGVKLTMDISQPLTQGLHPIVVQIYGGAWQRGAPNSNEDAAHWLAAHGYTVFALDYRHAPAFRWPAQIEDVRTDLAWIRDHAAEYGGDTSRVAFLGRSAGGQLAMIAAYSDSPLPAKAVVSLYGAIDMVTSYHHPPVPDPIETRDVEQKLYRGTPEQFPELYRAGTVYSYVTKREPPTLLIYAGRDNLVEAKYGRALRDSLVAKGTSVAYLEIPWANHAFDEVFNGPSNQLALYSTERFLARTLQPRLK